MINQSRNGVNGMRVDVSSNPVERWGVAVGVFCLFVVTYVTYWALLRNSNTAVATDIWVQILFFTYFPLFTVCVLSDPGRLFPSSQGGGVTVDEKNGYQAVSTQQSSLRIEESNTLPSSQDFDQPHTDREQGVIGAGGGGMCDTCRLRRPLRSKHCKICGYCVKDMDHHCVFTGNCVGSGNRLLFTAMIYVAFPSHLLVCYLIIQHTGGFSSRFGRNMREHPYLDVLFGFHLLATLFHLALVISHTYLISINLTTNEFWNWTRYPRLQATARNQFGEPVFRNPNDLGFLKNWSNFLSSQLKQCPPRLNRWY
ncbi:hypothetical protein AAMO2058_000511000 [Amorphochlora amoebiformis]